MPKHLSSILNILELFFLEGKKPWPSLLQHQRGFGAVVVGGFSCRKNRFFNVSLQKAPWQGFRNYRTQQRPMKNWMGRWQTTPIRAALLSFQSIMTWLQRRRLALPASIPLTLLTLLTSSEVLPCTHRAAMSLDIFQRSELARVRSPPLFEQDRDRGKLQGVWGWGKAPIGKRVASCTFARREEHLKHRWPLLQEHLFVPKHVSIVFCEWPTSCIRGNLLWSFVGCWPDILQPA